MTDAIQPTRIVMIPMSDGAKIAAAIYLPSTPGRFPTLFAASPYRFDNNGAPAVPVFLWRETGPIEWYVDRGYAFVHMDIRGTGRSGGDYRYQCKREQRDLYEVIEWIAAQPWSSGKVAGIGQSYYARMQWFMGIQNPPHLAGIAPYDGNIDTYRASAYTGGIPGYFPSVWFEQTVRPTNHYPHQGPPRLIEWDYPLEVRKHPTYDAFWRERAAADRLHKIRVPVFSIAVWSKVDLHLNGNIVGFQRTRSDKKLLVFGSSNLFAAVADFSSVAFHEKFMLPFYEWCLKGIRTSYVDEPPVRYFLTGAETFLAAQDWPPPARQHLTFHLSAAKSGSVTSLNDGSLKKAAAKGAGAKTEFHYPNKGWRLGAVGFGPDGRPDPVRRVLTFNSSPLPRDLDIAGPIMLVLFASTTRTDADFVIKVSEQLPQSAEDRAADIQPASRVVTKGWLRASHRAIDQKRSRENAPWYTHTSPRPLTPGEIYELTIAIMPTAYRFKRGSRIRIEIANCDSQFTELVFHHVYGPDKVGTDTIHHSAAHPSRIILPVLDTRRGAATKEAVASA